MNVLLWHYDSNSVHMSHLHPKMDTMSILWCMYVLLCCCIHLVSNSTWPLPSANLTPQSVSRLSTVWLQRDMRGIITETMRALHQAAAVTVSRGPTTAPRLDKNLTQGQSKLLVVTLWTYTWAEVITSENLCVNVTVDPCHITDKGSAGDGISLSLV